MTAEQVDNYRAAYFLVYRNDVSKLQIEICADETWFHSVIRRLISDTPADYKDSENCVSFEDIAIWESEHNYNHFDYVTGGQNGLEGVILNTAKLFKRNQKLLTTNIWLDTNKIQNLKNKDFEKTFGKLPDRNKPTYFWKLKKEIKELLKGIDFQFILDSDSISPFDQNSMTNKLILKVNNTKIEIRQKDWRDDYFIYELFKNDKKMFEIDISEIEIDRAVELTINKIKPNL